MELKEIAMAIAAMGNDVPKVIQTLTWDVIDGLASRDEKKALLEFAKKCDEIDY